jgi:lipopolysaccharide biosynthesis regulator YciM
MKEQFQISHCDREKFHAAVAKEYDRSFRSMLTLRQVDLQRDVNRSSLTDEEYQKLLSTNNDDVALLLSKLKAAYEQLHHNQMLVTRVLKILEYPPVRCLRTFRRKLLNSILLIRKYTKKCFEWIRNLKRAIATCL